MSIGRAPGRSVAAFLVAVAVSLLGFRLFLPGTASACASSGARCCCGPSAPDGDPAPPPQGCDCSMSPAAPIPAATLASSDALPLPALVVASPDPATVEAPARVLLSAGPSPRARSAPTQALLLTFRN